MRASRFEYGLSVPRIARIPESCDYVLRIVFFPPLFLCIFMYYRPKYCFLCQRSTLTKLTVFLKDGNASFRFLTPFLRFPHSYSYSQCLIPSSPAHGQLFEKHKNTQRNHLIRLMGDPMEWFDKYHTNNPENNSRSPHRSSNSTRTPRGSEKRPSSLENTPPPPISPRPPPIDIHIIHTHVQKPPTLIINKSVDVAIEMT